VSDQGLRDLARAWRASGADADGAAWLAARLRAGTLAGSTLETAAQLGLGAAIALLGDDAPDTAWPLQLPPPPLTHDGIGRLWARHFLPAWEAAHPGDPRARTLLDRLRRRGDRSGSEPGAPLDLDLPDLSTEDAYTLRYCFEHDPVILRLEWAVPERARSLDPVHLARQLRADYTAELLRTPLDAEAMRELLRARIELVACDDAPLEVVQRVATWLHDLSPARPRPLHVAVGAERPAFTGVDQGVGKLGEKYVVRGPRFVQLVTLRRDPQGWFARHAPDAPRASVVHLGEQARVGLEASPEAFLAHFVARQALDGLLGTAAPLHEPSRGCAFDLCRDEKGLDGRILAGAVCRECHALLRADRDDKGWPEVRPEHLDALLRILAAARERMLAAP